VIILQSCVGFVGVGLGYMLLTCNRCDCEGWYGVPEGIMFYMPVRYPSPGQYQVIDDLPLTSSVHRKIHAIVKVRIHNSSCRAPLHRTEGLLGFQKGSIIRWSAVSLPTSRNQR